MGLPELSDAIRNNFKWAVILILIGVFLWVIWGIVSSVSQNVFDPRREKQAFGVLPSPIFTKTYEVLTSKQIQTTLSFPDPEKEQEIEEPVFKTSLTPTSQEFINNLTRVLGVSSTNTKKENLTIWENTNTNTKLIYNSATGQFTYKQNLSQNSNILSRPIPKDEQKIINDLKVKLTEREILPLDISEGIAEIKYISLKGSNRSVVNINQANAVEVSFYRKVNNITSIGEAPIRVLLAADAQRIIEFDYRYIDIGEVGSRYPIISQQKSYEQLQNKKAFSSNRSDFDSLVVNEIYLSYWESQFYQPYLHPVWVLSGRAKKAGIEEDFRAFVPALNPSFLEAEAFSVPPPLP